MIPGESMGIPVKLEVFEGPLDLLLHLIDKNKIDIYDHESVHGIYPQHAAGRSQCHE